MTIEEKIICKEYLNDLDKYHSCNEYHLIMGLLDAEPCEDAVSRKDVIKILEDGWKRGIYPSTGKIMALHSVNPKPRWIPCEERLPEEDYWLGGSGKQFSDSVLVSILNNDDDNEWICISHTIDGEWALNLPKHCKILAWAPLPKPYKEVEG